MLWFMADEHRHAELRACWAPWTILSLIHVLSLDGDTPSDFWQPHLLVGSSRRSCFAGAVHLCQAMLCLKLGKLGIPLISFLSVLSKNVYWSLHK